MKREATAPKSLDGLVAAGASAPERAAALGRVADRYAIAVTPYLLGQLEGADPDLPLARQYLPSAGELEVLPEERADPIGDDARSPVRASCIAIPTACC